jgi:alkyl hydroperoxide reductase subunit AhpC
MKTSLQKTLFAIIILAFPLSQLLAQGNAANKADSAAIRQTALDYIDGYYSGDVSRIEKAVHPDLNKATPRDLPQSGRTTLAYTTYSGLVEFTRAKVGALDDTARHIQVKILNIENDIANVKIISANFIDYIQEIKLDSQWKIVNVIYTSGIKGPPRLKDFNPKTESPAVEKAVLTYLGGLSAGDAGKLEIAIDHDFNKITLQPIVQTGKTSIRRQRYDAVMENAYAGIGKQDEIYRNNRVTILDITDGLAVARCETTGVIEFLQLYKGNGQWKIFNSIARPNTSLTLAQAMTVTSGEPMPDFTLPVYGGGEFNLAGYRGKNVMLIFPRGWTGNQWCSYCPYQYMELEQLEKKSGIMEKNNLEIAFVMPYSSERIKDWLEKFPDALQTVGKIKNPQPQPAAGSIQAEYADWAKGHFPIVFDVKKDDAHDVIPILVDENRTLSRNLKIFTNFWDGISAEQNMASVFIIDKNGILRFKYIGQMTEDRPSVEFLLNFIRNI